MVDNPGPGTYDSSMATRIISCLLLCLGLLAPAFSYPSGLSLEQLVMDSWNDRSGLPSNSVLDVVQDAQGYIWIASYDGLVRFDGRTFKLFTKGSNTGFESNSARVLLCGKDGTLWIGTNTDGLFSCRNNTFAAYGKDSGLPDLSIRSLAFDDAGKLWVSTAAGIAVSEGDGFKTVSPGEGIANFFVPLRDGNLVTGSNKKGLWTLDSQGLHPWRRSQDWTDAAFYAAGTDQRNQLWLGTGSGSILVLRGNEPVTRIEPEALKGGTVKDFLAGTDGTMWIATDKGLFYGRDQDFRQYSEANGLPNNSVTSLCQDREGSLWVGTERGGLVKFSPGKFVNITQREGLAGNAVNAVTEDAWGSLWVGSDQGLAWFPADKDPYAKDPARRQAVDKVLADLGQVRIRQIRKDQAGGLWFATYSDFGLYHFDGRTSESWNTGRGLPGNKVRLSLEDSAGHLWIGTTSGLVRVDQGKLRVYGKADGLRNEFILDVHEDARKRLWVGLDGGGLARLEPDGRFVSWTTAEGLAGNVVFRLFSDRQGRLWIATSDGLSLFLDDAAAVRHSVFRTFRARDGLLSDSIYQILQEDSGKLWLITSRGLAVLDPALLTESTAPVLRKHMQVLDRLDGLAGQPSANSWAYMSPLGVMYFPTIGGLSVFNPQSVNHNPNPPPVILEQVSVDGQALGDLLAPWQSDPSPQRIVMQFTALSFMVPQKVGFNYRLEGYDQEWQSTSYSERTAVYTNLPPGTYTFRVKAWNNDGVVNESGASTTFTIPPRFVQTPWFYTLMALLLIGIGFIINLIRTLSVERHREELERLVAQRTEDLNLERLKSEALLLNILPVQVANELKARGAVQPQVHQDVAVMFADLVGFTEKSSRIGPSATIAELNSLFSTFDAIAARHGCERIKTIGDAYLCVCGLNDNNLDARERTLALCRAGLEMIQSLKTRENPAGIAWELRIGLHCGPVVAGVVGIDKYIYDIFGDTVNTAARMQGESRKGCITVAEKIASLVQADLDFTSRGAVEIKGKGAMELYCLDTGPGPDEKK